LRINPRGFSQIPYKAWGFVLDIAITYFIMGFIIPLSGLQTAVKDILYPISDFMIHELITHGDFAHFNVLSAIEFFIVFHSS